MRIGIDIDNTLIEYDALFLTCARERGVTLPDNARKTAIRDRVRALLGETAWQHMQAQVYGPRITEARLFDGARDCLCTLRAQGHSLHLVSHKTRYSNLLQAQGPDLHQAVQHFLAVHAVDSLVDSITLCPTRETKCAAIAEAKLHVFIDDLEEVLSHPAFPPTCRKIHFGGHGPEDCLLHWQALPLMLAPHTAQGTLLAGGRNSRVLRVGDMVMKHYPDDGRQRCRTEWQALQWLAGEGFTNIPQPLACLPAQHTAILSFIHGSPPSPDARAVHDMVQFSLALYAARSRARHWQRAADACFTRQELCAHLQQRVHRLRQCPHTTILHKAMHAFVRQELKPALDMALARAATWEILCEELRMPSPSDFGLHNAVRSPENSMVFLDFDYFGVDDPAKFMADILLHAGGNLSLPQRKAVIAPLLAACQQAGDHAIKQRLMACLPLWRIKWCCILLNAFLAPQGETYDETLLHTQLTKAQHKLYEHTHDILD